MGAINAANQIQFQSCRSLFAQIRKDLDSFDALDLIDNSDLYRYVKDVISSLGIGYYMEKQAVLPIKRYKVKLPEDFYLLYSAYKCNGSNSVSNRKPLLQDGSVMYLENTCETILHCKCDIEKTVDKITTKLYLDQEQLINIYDKPELLRLTTSQFCDPESPNLYHRSSNEININNGYLNCNFESGNVYLKYYGFPFDDDGLPMLPDDHHVKKAIEDYIKFKLLEKWWTNSDSPDIERKMMKWEENYRLSFADASYKGKLFSFESVIGYNKRNKNRLDVYQFYRV